MKNLLYKEFKLALHPTAILFLALSAMVLIPNYPYYVTFFYTCLGIFFICMNGRENQDIFYSMLLPVRKKDIVRARFGTAVILQLLQLVLVVPFAFLRGKLMAAGNAVGMDANIALLGLALGMLGLFNLIFFTRYYKDPNKVGVPFVLGSTAVFLYMGVAEALCHIIPFMRDQLDTPDPQFLTQKLIVLACGGVVYALLTWISCRLSQRSFERIDL